MPRPQTPSVSVVVPVYNEASLVQMFVETLHKYLSGLSIRYQIIVVDDGSTDNTLAYLKALPKSWPLQVLALSRNFGKEAALTAGLDQAEGDAVLFIDGDFQHPFEMIEIFLERWKQGADMVYGICTGRKTSWLHRLLTRVFYRMIATGEDVLIPPNGGDFRLMDRKVVQALKRLPERRRLMKGLCAWVGFRSEGIPFKPPARPAGVSKLPSKRLVRLALTGITSFSAMPLRVVAVLGFFQALLAVAFGTYILIDAWVFGRTMAGWPTLVVLICLLGGIQMLGLGVLGEYIAGMFNEIKQRPMYLVQERFGKNTLTEHQLLKFPKPGSGNNGRHLY